MTWFAKAISFLCLALLPLAVAAAEPPSVDGVRLGQHGERTRVVLDLSQSVTFEFFTLADPYRVVVDLQETAWKADAASFRVRAGLVAGMRFGLFKPGNSRLVLDANRPVKVADAFLVAPSEGYGHRFVIDLLPTDRESFLADLRPPRHASEVEQALAPVTPTVPSAPPQTNAQAPASAPPAAPPPVVVAVPGAPPMPVPSYKPKRPKGAVRIVVLDPGHGGVDPGTVALNGRFEKHVVLDYAREVRRLLLARGRYQVLLTREDDIFVPLRDRVRIAHEASADLFISIHADSIADRSIRGGAVYTLSETGSDAEADALAARENKADLIAGVVLDQHDEEVVSILIELAQRETMNYAVRFAAELVPQFLRHEVPLRSNPHRFAAFRVLKAPDVPSVLLELGYLTNQADQRYLLTDQARQMVARAIATAIDKYFADLGS